MVSGLIGEPFDEYVFDKVIIEPGSYKLLVSNLEAFRSKYGSGLDELIIGEWGKVVSVMG